MALDRRKMHFFNGKVLTQAQEEERKRNAPKYKVNPTTLVAFTMGLLASTRPPRR